MSLTEKQRHELKKFVKELSQYRGRHTELVTVYVPEGYDMNKIINQLQQEQGTAVNIKSTSTRNNVIDALERMIHHLRIYKRTPEYGLAVFSGNVAEREGQSDVKVWSLEPPVPVKTKIYRCDKAFLLDLLEDMLDTKEMYGMVVMDRRDASLAFLKGKTIIPIVKTHSQVPGKTRAGGQSAARFERLRDGAAKDHYKKIADHMKAQFLGLKELKGILLGGPGVSTHDFLEKGQLTTELKNKIIAVKDISYTGDFGLQELLENCEDVLAKEEVIVEKKIMQRFFDILAKTPNKVSYGKKEVLNHLQMGVVDTLLLSDELDDPTIEELETEAKKTGSEVMLISTETREGVQLRDIGKIAAILRYEVHT